MTITTKSRDSRSRQTTLRVAKNWRRLLSMQRSAGKKTDSVKLIRYDRHR